MQSLVSEPEENRKSVPSPKQNVWGNGAHIMCTHNLYCTHNLINFLMAHRRRIKFKNSVRMLKTNNTYICFKISNNLKLSSVYFSLPN